jgi:hypothetical protein
MTVKLPQYLLHFHPIDLPSPVGSPNVKGHYDEWQTKAWRLDLEYPSDGLPLHNPAFWDYRSGSLWRYGPPRMTPVICFQELIRALWEAGFGMLAGYIEEEVMALGLGMK